VWDDSDDGVGLCQQYLEYGLVQLGYEQFFVEVLLFPLSTSVKFAVASPSDCITVGPPIFLSFLDQSFVDECVEVRIQPPMIDIVLVVAFEFALIARPCGSSSPVMMYSRSRWKPVKSCIFSFSHV